MKYKLLFALTLTFSLLNGYSFEKINPSPSKKMLENQLKAQTCTSPVMASETISEDFKYGCFCGKNYPITDNNKTKDFRKLKKNERIKLIETFYSIKPYDDIDKICMQHDICYLYKGKKSKACNRAIYSELKSLSKEFKVHNELKKNRQCKYLSNDIASVFRTIFASSDDKMNMLEFGSLMFNTSITIAQKTVEKSFETVTQQDQRYPPKEERCLILK
ncbi:MAG: Unknown protein [uncultured Sulfurovum sp.]|uniref:Phospholipase A2 domain-containing protein n=1 Tax=uncultured Sulfurovum sp. TaxID=269237 RepID=A0A6S6SQF0_9BACT|nr:MAG: Unknown protein [uncultured Sulfurovum sp.]